MVDCQYPLYAQLWFWLIVIGILFLAIGLIVWDSRSRLVETWWIWVLIVGGAILFVLGLVLAIWQWWSKNRDMEAPDEEMASLVRHHRIVQHETIHQEI